MIMNRAARHHAESIVYVSTLLAARPRLIDRAYRLLRAIPQCARDAGMGSTRFPSGGPGRTKMKTPTMVLLALLSVLAAGCAAWRAEKAEESAPTANLAGTWTGSAGTGGVFVPVSLTLTQVFTAVKGTIDIAGRPDYSGDVTGSVEGELLKLALQETTPCRASSQAGHDHR